MPMNQTLTVRALVLAVSLAAGAALAQDAMTSAQVRSALTDGGYTEVRDIEFKDGLWKADVKDATGNKIDVRFDPATGRIYPENAGATSLGEADIRARLTAEGFTRIDDVKFDDGLWEAEADDAQGQRMDLKLDPQDGRIISQSRD
ncbi:PepSY domain-containing protein [Luteimonas sp. SJ-16]|uniref:PepSY domain-containing protein n=2 Tax=Luteimonas deserti TaxID=2752306 RepID=A0A7Z0TXC6_9GAMM|nr:PepSY domain-containing protein [Luteimonas deserti]